MANRPPNGKMRRFETRSRSSKRTCSRRQTRTRRETRRSTNFLLCIRGMYIFFIRCGAHQYESDASEPLGRDGQKYDDTSERRKEERQRRIRGFRMTVLYSATTWLIPTQYGRTIPGSVRGTDCFSESWAVGGRQSHSRRCAGRAARVRRPQRPPTKRAASLKCDRMGHHPRKTNYPANNKL